MPVIFFALPVCSRVGLPTLCFVEISLSLCGLTVVWRRRTEALCPATTILDKAPVINGKKEWFCDVRVKCRMSVPGKKCTNL